MKVIETVAELQAQSRRWRNAGQAVALVPTMGALHDGHLSLVREAQAQGQRVIVSIFVNPLQFGPTEDFAAYPRSFEDDTAKLVAAGVDVLFHPSVAEMYPDGSATRVIPGPVADPLEGERRRGHFIGVATVVARLLGAAIPDRAYFGRKDAQQVAVIRAMVRDLAMPVEIVACPTIREADGLAMSSRNRYLDAEARNAARAISRALAAVQRGFRDGIADSRRLTALMRAELRREPGVEIDYAVVVDPDTFENGKPARAGSLALVAARVGAARLIDNAEVGSGDLLHLLNLRPVEVEAAWRG
jgi:pantoate--beta-alanine ligase